MANLYDSEITCPNCSRVIGLSIDIKAHLTGLTVLYGGNKDLASANFRLIEAMELLRELRDRVNKLRVEIDDMKSKGAMTVNLDSLLDRLSVIV